jgi:hypothetical protein
LLTKCLGLIINEATNNQKKICIEERQRKELWMNKVKPK